MPYYDLREFLETIEKKGQLARVRRPVKLQHEISAVCRRALDLAGMEKNKALLFENVDGSSIPVLANLLSTRSRYALAMETQVEQIHERFMAAATRPIKPVLVKDGPSQEVVKTGEEVDLFQLPIPTWFELDPAPYITACCQITKDPETGTGNIGIYRAMVHDRNHLGILAAPYRHLAIQCRKAHERNQSFPVAICLGPDPTIYMAAQAPLPFGQDEMALAGALRGEPVEMVKCLTIDLEVPATAEVILEGEMLPGMMMEEGPFGELTGYYGGPRALRPAITIKAITHRRNPIFHATLQGRPPNESSIISLIPNEVEVLRNVRLPGLRTIHITEGSASFVAVASIHKLYEGYGKVMAAAILSTEPGRLIKTLIVVDEDIDPFDRHLIDWALATRFQPAEDAVILKGVPGVTLDPSMAAQEREQNTNRTSKIIIDATRPLRPDFPQEASVAPAVMNRVVENWPNYGIN